MECCEEYEYNAEGGRGDVFACQCGTGIEAYCEHDAAVRHDEEEDHYFVLAQ